MTTLVSGAAQICAGQLVELTPGEYDWLILTVGVDGPLDETVRLHYRGGVDPEFLRCRAGTGICRVPVPRHDILVAIRLPDRPDVRITDIVPVESERA